MKTVSFLFFFLVMPVFAYAEINIGYTAEWLSHNSCLIAKATPVEFEKVKGEGVVWFTKIRFRLDEVIKGPQSTGDTVTIYDFNDNRTDAFAFGDAQKNNKQLLVFASIAEHMFNQIDGKYVFTENHVFKSAYYPSKPVTQLFTPEFKLLTDFNDLLKRTSEQIEHESGLKDRYWKGKIEKKSIEVPFDSEAHRHLYLGSTCYLWVPEYKEEKKP
jgi:hypothetical protein